MQVRPNPQEILDSALIALSANPDCRAMLDELEVPIYTTDSHGQVTYWNRACVEFAGREPQLGHDRWCVTWQLFTTAGEPLPHDQCPMAQAIKEQRVIRDSIVIAERPDGTRRAFKPYPTPLFDSAGALVGAVNLLIDVTEEQCDALHDQAKRCRRLAESTYSRDTLTVLTTMADGFDKTADELARQQDR